MPDLTLDLRYLKYAIQVAEAGSFRRAAERIAISQSRGRLRKRKIKHAKCALRRERSLQRLC